MAMSIHLMAKYAMMLLNRELLFTLKEAQIIINNGENIKIRAARTGHYKTERHSNSPGIMRKRTYWRKSTQSENSPYNWPKDRDLAEARAVTQQVV
jgi:hypothetical protein